MMAKVCSQAMRRPLPLGATTSACLPSPPVWERMPKRPSLPPPTTTTAPGYPACPDHSVKREMFALLQCDEIGMHLTDSLSMMPAASVSGFYLAHPQATYFNVGRIGEDQVQDMAARRGVAVEQVRRWLGPNL